MLCSHPLLGYQTSEGEKLKIISYPGTDVLDYWTHYKINHNLPKNTKYYIIPCKQCAACRLATSQEWANRIYGETLTSFCSYGVTLTYDDEYLPRGKRRYTLEPDHLKKFMKDLREYYSYHFNDKNIRFFAVGEYGSKIARPHYHLILFNFDPHDLRLCKERSQTGEYMFESDILSKIWKKGRVRLNLVTWQFAAYCARYMMKKQTGKNKGVYEELGIVPEFQRMSNRPGIGYKFLDDNQEKFFDSQGFLVKRGERVQFVPLPKYYLKKLEELGFDISNLKSDREEAATNSFKKMRYNISQDVFKYLESLEGESSSKAKALQRL